MTERIDLDAMDADGEDEESASPNAGDWLWKGEGDPEDEPEPSGSSDADDDRNADATPHVPYANRDKPVGIPVEQGGGGSAPAGSTDTGDAAGAPGEADADADANSNADTHASAPAASGPHGGDADDMTMALTYRGIRRLADPVAALADAEGWTDWIGVVGDVDAHVINKFVRDNALDIDFFNGTGTGPDERLREIDRRSMFFADRMVVVGVEGDEWIADRAEWEYVPLADAASKAGWKLTG